VCPTVCDLATCGAAMAAQGISSKTPLHHCTRSKFWSGLEGQPYLARLSSATSSQDADPPVGLVRQDMLPLLPDEKEYVSESVASFSGAASIRVANLRMDMRHANKCNPVAHSSVSMWLQIPKRVLTTDHRLMNSVEHLACWSAARPQERRIEKGYSRYWTISIL
jgi:hypothetical protein